MYVNLFSWLIVYTMHLILNCDAVGAELSCIRINSVKRGLCYVSKCVCMVDYMYDALDFVL